MCDSSDIAKLMFYFVMGLISLLWFHLLNRDRGDDQKIRPNRNPIELTKTFSCATYERDADDDTCDKKARLAIREAG